MPKGYGVLDEEEENISGKDGSAQEVQGEEETRRTIDVLPYPTEREIRQAKRKFRLRIALFATAGATAVYVLALALVWAYFMFGCRGRKECNMRKRKMPVKGQCM